MEADLGEASARGCFVIAHSVVFGWLADESVTEIADREEVARVLRVWFEMLAKSHQKLVGRPGLNSTGKIPDVF